MAFESFYGGRPGASLAIVHSYSSVREMVEQFRKGGMSTDQVNYGQYAAIDNKTDPDHGNIYRRGLNYSNAEGGAEYIGNMAGPQGEPGGIHIIGRVNSIDDLRGKTPEYWGEEYKGQVMAVGPSGSIPDLYAYDYINNVQFYFGNMPSAPVTVVRRTVDYDDEL